MINRNFSYGFSMLEIMVTIIVISFGLLGLAGLQTLGLKNNHNATVGTQIAGQAYDMSDRMRANIAAVTAGSYNNPTATYNANCLNATGCTAAQMAQHDAYEWTTNLTTLLPSGRGAVCVDSTPNDGTPAAPACDNTGSLYTIKIWWDDERTGGTLKRFSMSFQP